jgi:hypothetical protein
MMFAERYDRARLRTVSTLRMLCDETDFVANLQLVEAVIRDAVAMEIDFVAVCTCNEAAIPIGEETRNSSVIGHRVELDVAASAANVILEQPASCVERVADRDMDILMGMVRLGVTPDHDLAPGNFEINPHPEQITLLTAGVLAFDDNATRYDPVKEAFERLGARTYSRRDGIRRVHMAESNLKWQLHRILLSLSDRCWDGERLGTYIAGKLTRVYSAIVREGASD